MAGQSLSDVPCRDDTDDFFRESGDEPNGFSRLRARQGPFPARSGTRGRRAWKNLPCPPDRVPTPPSRLFRRSLSPAGRSRLQRPTSPVERSRRPTAGIRSLFSPARSLHSTFIFYHVFHKMATDIPIFLGRGHRYESPRIWPSGKRTGRFWKMRVQAADVETAPRRGILETVLL